MHQMTCTIHDSYDAVTFLDGVNNSSYYDNAKTVLVNVFTDRIQKEYIEFVRNLIKEKIEKAKIVGITCVAEMSEGQKIEGKTMLSVLLFEEAEIEIFEYDFTKISIEDAEKEFVEKIRQEEFLKGILIYTTSLKNDISGLILSAFQDKGDSFPVFGAGAGYGDGSPFGKDTFVFGEKTYENASVIVFFKGENLRIFAGRSLGWHPIGKEMEVTEVENNQLVKTLDNIPIGDIYKKYLGVSSVKYFSENTSEFPFMIQRGETWIARLPYRKEQNNAVSFTTDIHKGEKVFFSYASKQEILLKSCDLAQKMERENVDGILLFACKNRYMYLKEDEGKEIQAFYKLKKEMAGCYAFAEILINKKGGGLQNGALLAVGFRELNQGEGYFGGMNRSNEKVLDEREHFFEITENQVHSIGKEKHIVPFEERIITFLRATTRDLFHANQRLQEMAVQDPLTKIFNRRRISEIIHYELQKRDAVGTLNVLMFDIDDFKYVNDNFGHDVGDEVLVRMVETVKSTTRSQDSIGRWGGEEFMVVLPRTLKEDAVVIAERIRKNVYNLQWPQLDRVTISMGVATARAGDKLQDLYERVDRRLYLAKENGKNCVVSTDEKTEEDTPEDS